MREWKDFDIRSYVVALACQKNHPKCPACGLRACICQTSLREFGGNEDE